MDKKTYKDILTGMKLEYTRLSGNNPDEASDIGIRLGVLAGEIYELSNSIGWLYDQIFPQSATGEYLEKHCEERGIKRKEQVKAVGKLKFMRKLPLAYDVLIPKGTVCCISDDSAFSYITTADAKLLAQNFEVEVRAEAVSGGKDYNCGNGKINTLVSMPEGIESVTNSVPFMGGEDKEDDDHLRERLLAAYKTMPNGANGEYYRRTALEHEGVGSAGVKPMVSGAGTVGVYLWGNTGPVPQAVINEVKSDLQKKREINVNITVANATEYKFTSYVYIKPCDGCIFDEAKEKTMAAVAKYFSMKKVGDPVYKAEIGGYIMANCPVQNYYFPTSTSDFNGDGAMVPTLVSNTVVEL